MIRAIVRSFIKYPGIISTLLANLIVIAGVLFWHWDMGKILLLYWLETLIIGLFNVFKMVHAPNRKEDYEEKDADIFRRQTYRPKSYIIPFFIAHYGIFMLTYGFFIVVLSGLKVTDGQSRVFFDFPGTFKSVLPALLSLLISHGFSFFYNFLYKKEYLRTTTKELFNQPYSRIIVIHLTLLGGMFASLLIGVSTALLIVLVAAKIITDINSHIQERKKASGEDIKLIKFSRQLKIGIALAAILAITSIGTYNLLVKGTLYEIQKIRKNDEVFRQAIKSGNINGCEEVKAQGYNTEIEANNPYYVCISSLTGTQIATYDGCISLNKDVYKRLCLHNLALIQKNPSFCLAAAKYAHEEIANGKDRMYDTDRCITGLGDCNNTLTGLKDMCILYQNLYNGKLSSATCSGLGDISQKDECHAVLTAVDGDIQECSTSSVPDQCLYRAVELKAEEINNNKKLDNSVGCGGIKSEELRKACLKL